MDYANIVPPFSDTRSAARKNLFSYKDKWWATFRDKAVRLRTNAEERAVAVAAEEAEEKREKGTRTGNCNNWTIKINYCDLNHAGFAALICSDGFSRGKKLPLVFSCARGPIVIMPARPHASAEQSARIYPQFFKLHGEAIFSRVKKLKAYRGPREYTDYAKWTNGKRNKSGRKIWFSFSR